MRRTSSKNPVPVTMYRHFAAITLVLTTMLAIFSDGERSRSIVEQIKTQQELNKLKLAERRAKRSNALGSSNFNIGKGRSIDTSGPEPVASGPDRPSSDSVGWSGPPSIPGSAAATVRPLPPMAMTGTGNQMNSSSAGEANGSRLAKPRPPRQITRSDLERMLAASRNRSGTGDPSLAGSGAGEGEIDQAGN
jgi:hypothetical protein